MYCTSRVVLARESHRTESWLTHNCAYDKMIDGWKDSSANHGWLADRRIFVVQWGLSTRSLSAVVATTLCISSWIKSDIVRYQQQTILLLGNYRLKGSLCAARYSALMAVARWSTVNNRSQLYMCAKNWWWDVMRWMRYFTKKHEKITNCACEDRNGHEKFADQFDFEFKTFCNWKHF